MTNDNHSKQSSVDDTSGNASASGDPTTSQPGTPGPKSPKIHPDPPSPRTRIVRDDTDVGGPLVIESDDPDLNPPQAPIDPFPTNGTPQIDPPVDKKRSTP
jgi:hypothetical protein